MRNHIAKTLVPLLQIWLYASRGDGSFEKRYGELCEILGIREYFQISRIREQLGPSLDELTVHGYLSDWAAEKTADSTAFKIVFRHGEKFHRDRQGRLAQQESAGIPAGHPRRRPLPPPVAKSDTDPGLVEELTKRGVGEGGARKLLAKLPSDRPLRELLEWGDEEIARQQGRIKNPAGFYIRLVEEHSSPPPTFESSATRNARQRAEFLQQKASENAKAIAEEEERRRRVLGERRLAVLTPDQRARLALRIESAMNPADPATSQGRLENPFRETVIRNRMIRHLAEQPMELLVVPQLNLHPDSRWEATIVLLLELQRKLNGLPETGRLTGRFSNLPLDAAKAA